ncbi:helix-turn-helix domain-containing protein [Castellaniella hirudinis]|uniref:helix-turn-helix domain-containing protein n=1 Tax=Castellaniella hirudinis TaxID=1144617 RepID=UPI0039C2D777
MEILDTADAIVIPGWCGADTPVPDSLKQALLRAHARRAQILGCGLGAFVLAEAGLLAGRSAATHWRYAALFSQRFPGIHLKSDILFIRDGSVWTSAGGAAAIDTCLHLLQALCGAEAAERIAQELVAGLPRLGDQAQRVARPLAARGRDAKLQRIIHEMQANPWDVAGLAELAAQTHMSVRTLTRRFRQLTGMTLVQWRLKQQLQYAKCLLETTTSTIETISQQAGFGSAVCLRRHFSKAFSLSPGAYRRQVSRDRPAS